MTGLSEEKIREILSRTLEGMRHPDSWVTGGVRLISHSDETLSGELVRLEGSSIVIATEEGERSMLLADVRNVETELVSPGPE